MVVDRGMVHFRFYEELNDLLPPKRQKREIPVPFRGRRSVKDVIESFNIPHTEVDLVLVNGVSVGFETLLVPGDRVSVYPLFESLDIASVQRLRPRPLREPKFVCDVHLGKLAGKLRLLGFDTLYRNDYADPEIIDIQERDRRAILTCDRNLLKPKRVVRGYLVRSRDITTQVPEVVHRFDLGGLFRPLTRCAVCNGLLREATGDEFRSGYPGPEPAPEGRSRFCPECGKLYWTGSHYGKIMSWIDGLASGY